MPDKEPQSNTHRVTITYDVRDKSFSIQRLDDLSIQWARGIVLAQQMLRQQGFTSSQAREGVLRAVMNNGNAILMSDIEKFASLIDEDCDTLSSKKIAEQLYDLADSTGLHDQIPVERLKRANSLIDELYKCLNMNS